MSRSLRRISGFMVFFFLWSCIIPALSLAQTPPLADVKDHWAKSQLASWAEKGWITGYEDGTVQPDRAVTRAEFVTFVNRSHGFQDQADIRFHDVAPNSWEHEQIATAVKAGIIQGFEDGSVRPDQAISRQEAAAIAARLLDLTDQPALAAAFKDTAEIAEWSIGAVGAAAAKGIILGYPDGTYKPLQSITRAEAVVVLERALAHNKNTALFDKAGTYGPAAGTETVNGNVTVSTSGVTLQNMIITGDLLLAEGIGEGEVFLENVKVSGKTIVQGGGSNSIHFNDTILLTVIVDKKNGTVRLVAEGASSVQQVQLQTPATIEESGATGAGFTEVILTELLPAGSKVTLKGEFETVDIAVKSISLEIPSGSVGRLNVTSQSGDVQLNLGAGSKLGTLILDAIAKITGEGVIEKATVNESAKDTTFEKAPVSQDGAGAIAGQAGGGGGGGGSSNNVSTPSKTATPTVTNTVYTNSTELHGTAEAGASVHVYIGSLLIGQGTAQADGSFKITFHSNTILTSGNTLSVTAEVTGKTVSDSVSVLVVAASGSSPSVQLQFLAHSSFVMTTAEKTVLIDPYHPMIGMNGFGLPGYDKPITPKAIDLLTITHQHEDHNYKDAVAAAQVIEGTIRRESDFKQEYKGVQQAVYGDITLSTVLVPHFSAAEPDMGEHANAAFIYEIGGLRIVHLGDGMGPIADGLKLQANSQLVADLKGANGIDVLMMPIGGADGESALNSAKLIEAMEALQPKVVIPMHQWKTLGQFLTAAQDAGFSIENKMSEEEIKASTLPNEAKSVIWVMDPFLNTINDLTKTGANDTTVTLSFSAPAGATAVKVQKRNEWGGWMDQATAEPLDQNSVSAMVTGLTPNTEHVFRLHVVGGSKYGVSNEVAAKTEAAVSGTKLNSLSMFFKNTGTPISFTFDSNGSDFGEIVLNKSEYFELALIAGYDAAQIASVKVTTTMPDSTVIGPIDMSINTAVYLPYDVLYGPNETQIVVTGNDSVVKEYKFNIVSSVWITSNQYTVDIMNVSNVPSDTSVDSFLAALQLKQGATAAVHEYDENTSSLGAERSGSDIVQTGNRVKVTGPDHQTTRLYEINVLP